MDGGDHCVDHVTIDKTNSKHPMHDQFMRASKWHLLLTLKSSDTFQNPELNFSLIMLLCCTVSITHCKCLCCGGLSHEFMDGWMDGEAITKYGYVLFAFVYINKTRDSCASGCGCIMIIIIRRTHRRRRRIPAFLCHYITISRLPSRTGPTSRPYYRHSSVVWPKSLHFALTSGVRNDQVGGRSSAALK